jgi:hypothetical protein
MEIGDERERERSRTDFFSCMKSDGRKRREGKKELSRRQKGEQKVEPD